MARTFKQGSMYVVEVEEAEWYSPSGNPLPAPVLDDLKHEYKAEAQVADCELMVIFCRPDPLFSMIEEAKRHKVFEHRFPVSKGASFKVDVLYTGLVDQELYAKLDELGRSQLVRRVRDEINKTGKRTPGKYIIQMVEGDKIIVLEQGRV
jgi:hypothetical protein